MFEVESLTAKEILNSRKKKTIEAELKTKFGIFKSSVPSGKSKGESEAFEIKTELAVKNIQELIAPRLKKKLVSEQKKVDRFLINLDGTKNKLKLGANTLLSISMVCCRAIAANKKLPLFRYVREIGNWKLKIENWLLPTPCFNILNGGAHAKNDLDIQEFMIIPKMDSFQKNLEAGIKVYQSLKKILENTGGPSSPQNRGGPSSLNFSPMLIIGDEGGFAPKLKNTKEALILLIEAIRVAGYEGKVDIGLDCAASQFYKNNCYFFENQKLNGNEMANFYLNILKKYPILFLEDPFEQNDWTSWRGLRLEIKKQKLNTFIVADDLTTTNAKRIKKAKRKKACEGVIIKPNQIGTITETLKVAKLAKKFGWKIIVSHRSGETKDDFISDLAVGVGADFIKSGTPGPIERMSKYNRLLEIEKELT